MVEQIYPPQKKKNWAGNGKIHLLKIRICHWRWGFHFKIPGFFSVVTMQTSCGFAAADVLVLKPRRVDESRRGKRHEMRRVRFRRCFFCWGRNAGKELDIELKMIHNWREILTEHYIACPKLKGSQNWWSRGNITSKWLQFIFQNYKLDNFFLAKFS